MDAMTLTMINCGNGCKVCDGYGIMTLYAGPRERIQAPCIECSPAENIHELEKEKAEAIDALHLSEEKKLIADHNKRILS